MVYTPDSVPVTFTSYNNSTITNTSYIEDGKTSVILILDPNLQSGLTNVNATLDVGHASTYVDKTAKATITIVSSAIDLSTNQTLYLTYEVPLNESVSWVSVLYKSTSNDFGTFQNEVDLIVNGEVVLNTTVTNLNYFNKKDSVSENVWYNINFLNWLFSDSSESKMALQTIIDNNPELGNLTGSELETGILSIIQEKYGFSGSEMLLLQYREYFTDSIVTYIDYPGDSVKITVEDPDTGELTDFSFGTPIIRESTMIYANGGYYHTYGDDPSDPTSILYTDAGYEGVRSFAFVTTKVTDEILQYWLDQKDATDENGTLLYPAGPMKAAYGAFLSSLVMIKCHDMVADQAATEYNVTWSRTTPIVVSLFDDAYRTVMTLECDHRFGMDVTGETGNVTAFHYACSSAINPIEHYVMKTLFPDDNGTSIVIGLGKELFNGLMPSIFMSNGYLVFKSSVDNMFLIFDPETGILRDVMLLNGTVSAAYCPSNLQTEWIYELGEKLDSTNPSNQPEWLNSTAQISMFSGAALGICLTDGAVFGGMTIGAVALSAALPVLGVFVACYIFDYCVDQGWLPPERCREILGILPPFAIVNILVYHEEPLYELSRRNPWNPPSGPLYDKNYNPKDFNPTSADDWENLFIAKVLKMLKLKKKIS